MKAALMAGLLAMAAVIAHAADEHPTLDAAAIDALRAGGLVIVMRHASSPRDLPDASTVLADNANGERQLDAQGRNDAEAMGAALRRLEIPIGSVESSPAYRALQTARLAGFADIATAVELGNEGMQAAGANHGAWLRERVARGADSGNALLITHGPNVNAAFPEYAQGMGEGEALILEPRGADAPRLVARATIGAWTRL
ncbi:MAG TPA: histidine phosphatase family protein [Pseudomonadales bacterium]